MLVETEPGLEVGPIATAAALHAVAAGGRFDLVLLGNEASDTGDYQVGIRLAHLLGWPAATGIKALAVDDASGSVSASRTYRGVLETFALELPCVVTVKEGINLPRYPSLPGGRPRATSRGCTRCRAAGGGSAADVRMTSLRMPDEPKKQATVLGQGADAVPALVDDVLMELAVVHDGVLLVELDRGTANGGPAAMADVSLRRSPGSRACRVRRSCRVVFGDPPVPDLAATGVHRARVRGSGIDGTRRWRGPSAAVAGRVRVRPNPGRGRVVAPRPRQRGAGAPGRDHRAADGGQLYTGCG